MNQNLYQIQMLEGLLFIIATSYCTTSIDCAVSSRLHIHFLLMIAYFFWTTDGLSRYHPIIMVVLVLK